MCLFFYIYSTIYEISNYSGCCVSLRRYWNNISTMIHPPHSPANYDVHVMVMCLSLCNPFGDRTTHLQMNYSNFTHWGRVTHICVGKLTIIGSDNGLSPDRRQAIIWTNAECFLIEPLGTNFSEILIEILAFSFKEMRLKVSSMKRRPFCLGLNVLTKQHQDGSPSTCC